MHEQKKEEIDQSIFDPHALLALFTCYLSYLDQASSAKQYVYVFTSVTSKIE